MSKAGLLPGASKRHPEARSTGVGDPAGGQTGPRGGGQQEEGKDLRRLVDPKGSADFSQVSFIGCRKGAWPEIFLRHIFRNFVFSIVFHKECCL